MSFWSSQVYNSPQLVCSRGPATETVYEIFEVLPGNQVVWLGAISGLEALRRKLHYYAGISSRDEIVAIDSRTHDVVAHLNAAKPSPQERARAGSAH